MEMLSKGRRFRFYWNTAPSSAVSLEIEGKPKHLIGDTGSKVSIIQPALWQSGVIAMLIKPYKVTEEALNKRGL
jgi:hypothetical protein